MTSVERLEGRRLCSSAVAAVAAGRGRTPITPVPVRAAPSLPSPAAQPGGKLPIHPVPAVEPDTFRVNAGGAAVPADAVGRSWLADGGFTGGTTGTDAALASSDDATVFGTYRAGADFTFARPVADGHYELFIEVADPTATVAGRRVFDVSAEGKTVVSRFDPAAAALAGPAAVDDNGQDPATTPVAVAAAVTVADDVLNLSFHGDVGQALVSGLTLVPTDVPTVAQPYALQSAAAAQVTAQADLHQVGLSLLFYAQDHYDRYPPDLATAYAEGALEPRNLTDPRAADDPEPRDALSAVEAQAWVNTMSDYVDNAAYAGKRSSAVAGTAIVAYENPAKVGDDPLAVLYGDGSTGLLSRADLAKAVPGSVPAGTVPVVAHPTPPAGDAKVLASRQNLSALGSAVFAYEQDHQRVAPPDWGTLAEGYGPGASTFLDPRVHDPATAPTGLSGDALAAWVNAHADYVLVRPGRRSPSAGDAVVAYEVPSGVTGGVDFLFADGRVEFRESAWAADTIAAITSTVGFAT